ncbi:MAG TPA: sulfatase [Opitutales bacterium]|jgi:iduronate 2-sulfatase|nr:sulfatase [Opitutales bacterium]
MNPISRRKFLGQVAGASAAASLAPALRAQTAASATPRKKNVLFIMADDMRVELGCYASMFGAQTPNLDALAKSGVRFDRNYCQFPICNPSRASLMSGRRPTVTGVLGNGTNLRNVHPDWTTMPQLFKNNGYMTARTGKIYHGGFDDLPSWVVGGGAREGDGGAGGHDIVVKRGEVPPQPADVLPPLPGDIAQAPHSDRLVVLDGMGEGHPDFHTADTAIKYLNDYKDQPFFIGCGFVKPHSPLCAPQSFLDKHDVSKIKLTPDFAAWPTVPPGFPPAAIRMLNADLFIGRGASEAEAKEVIRTYIASISWTDWNVGRVIAELDRLKLRDSTVIVFVCDHGYQLGEKGKWSKAGSLFEMGTRVPLMISAPGISGNGQSCFRMVESLDIYPTLVELCGLPKPTELEGTSLMPLLHDPQAAWDRPAYSVWSEDGRTIHGVAVRTEKWRYAEYGEQGKNGAMLFDVKADPLEMKNLANDPAQKSVCAELSALTRKYLAA